MSFRFPFSCSLFFSLLLVGGSCAAQTVSPAAGSQQPAASHAPVPPPPGDADLAKLRHQVENGHAAEVLSQLDVLTAQNVPAAGAEALRGLALYNLNRLPEAERAFAAALAQDAKNQEAAQMRALTLFRMGRPADAIPILEAHGSLSGAGTMAQDKADPHYLLALCYVDTRRYDDARHAFAAQYGFAPDSAAAYLLAARMLLRREYLPVARGFAEKAIALDPQLPLAHALLGEIALAGNHSDEAVAQLLEEQKRNPLEPGIYDRLGDAYSRAGKYTEAAAVLQQAVLLAPQSTGPYILLGKVMLKRQDAVSAATFLERAKAMDPANYMTRNLLGQAYRAMGRRDEAASETAEAERLQAASEPKLAQPK